MHNCVFCKIINQQLPASIVFENDHVMAIMDINPVNDGHVLVMPKRCYQSLHEMPDNLKIEVFKTVGKIEKALWQVEEINCEGTNVLQNNGRCAGQEVFHVHFHLIPRKHNDNFKLGFKSSKSNRAVLNSLATEINQAIE